MAGGRCQRRSKTQGKGCMKRVEHRLRCGSSLECGEHGIHSEIFCKSFATLSLEVTNDLPSSCAQRKFVHLIRCGLLRPMRLRLCRQVYPASFRQHLVVAAPSYLVS